MGSVTLKSILVKRILVRSLVYATYGKQTNGSTRNSEQNNAVYNCELCQNTFKHPRHIHPLLFKSCFVTKFDDLNITKNPLDHYDD